MDKSEFIVSFRDASLNWYDMYKFKTYEEAAEYYRKMVARAKYPEDWRMLQRLTHIEEKIYTEV